MGVTRLRGLAVLGMGLVLLWPLAQGLPVGAAARTSAATGPGVGTNVEVSPSDNLGPDDSPSAASNPSAHWNLAAGWRFADTFTSATSGAAISFNRPPNQLQTWLTSSPPQPLNPCHPYLCVISGASPIAPVFDLSGALYAGWLTYYKVGAFTAAQVAVSKSSDGGATWLRAAIVDTLSATSLVSVLKDVEWERPAMAVDDTNSVFHGRLYFMYEAARISALGATSEVRVAHSDDGMTWSSPVALDVPSFIGVGASLAIGPTGEVYAVQESLPNFPFQAQAELVLSKSVDGGVTFSPPVQVIALAAPETRLPNYSSSGRLVDATPTVAVDRSPGPYYGTVYLSWADQQPSTSRLHVYYSRSTNGGSTWATPVLIDYGNPNDAWEPAMSVDQASGVVSWSWYDRRDDPANKVYRVYYTQSKDSGASFLPEEAVADTQSDPTLLPFGTGDYMGMVSVDGVAHAFWADTRVPNSLATIWTAPINEVLAQGGQVRAYLPALSNGAYGGYVSAAYIQNSGNTPAFVLVQYLDQQGAPVGADMTLNLPVNGGWAVRQDNGHAFLPGSAGSAVIDSTQPIAAFVNEFAPHYVGDATSYTAISNPSGTGSTLYAPAIANGAYGGYTTGIGIVNAGDVSTTITITYRDASGNMPATHGQQTFTNVLPGAYLGVYSGSSGTLTDANLPSGFAGTATIVSIGSVPAPVHIAAVVNEVGPGGQFSSYDAVAGGATTLDAPVALNNAYGGFNTGIGIQNITGTAGTVTVVYYSPSGVPTPKAFNIAANGYLGIYQGSATDGPAQGAYTATISSTVFIAAIVNEVAPPVSSPTQSTSYNTFAGGTSRANLALVESAASDNLNTGLGIMNTGSAPTQVTIYYFDGSTGTPITSKTVTVGALAFLGEYTPDDVPAGTRATATVSAAAGGQVAVICNEVGAGTFMSYDGQ